MDQVPLITLSSEEDEGNKREKRQIWKNKKPNGHTTPPTKSGEQKQKANESGIGDEIELTERQEKELQENLTTWLAVMAHKDKKLANLLGHQFEDMILRCTIKSSNCTHPR